MKASGLISRMKRALGREHPPAEAHNVKAPCVGCGEETAAGSVFYSDRHVIVRSDGVRSFLCSSCDANVRAARKGRRLTDEEVRAVVENGSAAALLWGSGGPRLPGGGV